ncbi:MAG: hypothetical protein IJD93_05795 [Ruminococcus sp.]|nr:hypothetical protein [Ruminococcus sp.]
MRKYISRDILIFTVGGLTYGGIELLWRQRTHWSMVLTGGACLLSLYKLYTRFPRLGLPEKCVLGSLVITSIEFAVGCVVNLSFGMKVWDYSKMPFNILGQVCLLYSVLWGFLCIPVSLLCKSINKLTKKPECKPI